MQPPYANSYREASPWPWAALALSATTPSNLRLCTGERKLQMILGLLWSFSYTAPQSKAKLRKHNTGSQQTEVTRQNNRDAPQTSCD